MFNKQRSQHLFHNLPCTLAGIKDPSLICFVIKSNQRWTQTEKGGWDMKKRWAYCSSTMYNISWEQIKTKWTIIYQLPSLSKNKYLLSFSPNCPKFFFQVLLWICTARFDSTFSDQWRNLRAGIGHWNNTWTSTHMMLQPFLILIRRLLVQAAHESMCTS